MIRLRNLTAADEPKLVEYLNSPQVTRFLSSRLPNPYRAEDARWWIEEGSKQNAIVKAIDTDGEFCGVVGVYTQSGEYAHAAEIGYWVGRPFWGQGIATQAVSEYCQWIFSTTPLLRLYNPVSAPNEASIRVMQKSGFVLEGVLKRAVCHQGEYFDEHLYALTKQSE